MKSGKNKKYYVVLEGWQRGVFDSWALCEEQVSGYRGAVFKKFESLQSAIIYISDYMMSEGPYFINIDRQENMYEDYILFIDALEGILKWNK